MTEKSRKPISMTISRTPDGEVITTYHPAQELTAPRVVENSDSAGEIVYNIEEELKKVRGTLGCGHFKVIAEDIVIRGGEDD